VRKWWAAMPNPATQWQQLFMDWEVKRQIETAEIRRTLDMLVAEHKRLHALMLTRCEAGFKSTPPVNVHPSATGGIDRKTNDANSLVMEPVAANLGNTTPTRKTKSLVAPQEGCVVLGSTFSKEPRSTSCSAEEDNASNRGRQADVADAPRFAELSLALRLAVGWDSEKVMAVPSRPAAATEPDDVGVLRRQTKRLIESTSFHFLVGVMIIANFVTIGWQMHSDMRLALQQLPQAIWEDDVNIFFTVVFTMELTLRLFAERSSFFLKDGRYWNLFDFFVVFSAIVEVMFQGFSFAFLRVLRVLRVIRMMRIIRMFRFFRELRLMAVSLLSCLVSLMWAGIMMTLCMFLFGMVLLDGARDRVREIGKDDADFKTFTEFYGGVPQVVFSLILAITGGMDWYELLYPFISINPAYAIAFTLFVLFVMFGMLNILIGIFVQKSEELFHIDKELVMQEEMARNTSYLNQIKNLFQKVDGDASNTLTWEELEANLQDENVQTYFSLLQIDVSAAQGLFQLLDVDESGEVDVNEFIMGCMRLKGAAKSIDMATMLYDNKRMAMRWNHFFEKNEQQLDDIKATLRAIAGTTRMPP